jgi:hypothetical protein
LSKRDKASSLAIKQYLHCWISCKKERYYQEEYLFDVLKRNMTFTMRMDRMKKEKRQKTEK